MDDNTESRMVRHSVSFKRPPVEHDVAVARFWDVPAIRGVAHAVELRQQPGLAQALNRRVDTAVDLYVKCLDVVTYVPDTGFFVAEVMTQVLAHVRSALHWNSASRDDLREIDRPHWLAAYTNSGCTAP